MKGWLEMNLLEVYSIPLAPSKFQFQFPTSYHRISSRPMKKVLPLPFRGRHRCTGKTGTSTLCQCPIPQDIISNPTDNFLCSDLSLSPCVGDLGIAIFGSSCAGRGDPSTPSMLIIETAIVNELELFMIVYAVSRRTSNTY